ncbi:sulfite exporter TauE/SafE family protein [Clostridium sp. 19966]|uniref:urease accessory protein UreH domain-containing protein n=1 Tax=Clostridium sp. 19966 TaxID=2768166 RepID=UPI0028DDB803|nr:sulfite exporter TauE/SafE family protein [Clostridium sp. 19966]MDT8718652.1 sulfite exporter TauE/SafE family protein [Clostridium sp. 19966]
MGIRREKIKVYDMTCSSCENRVERAVKKLSGVSNAIASYSSQSAVIEYDDELCNISKIKEAIKKAGYRTEKPKDLNFIGIAVAAVAVILLGLKTSGFDMDSKLSNASYAVLFIVGILTSLHCVGMCGGIMLSQTLSKESKSKFEAIRPALLYNSGRVISYTILGGIIGALGSVFSLSITTKAGLQIFAGAFMIIMGLNMAGFSAFRKIHIHLPKAMCKVKTKSHSSFIVGLLNGLMPCGPLQTMQLYALGTGSIAKGALSMFVFSLGTVPLMLVFGSLSGLLSKGYTKSILKFSGVLIIVLGLIMGNRGFTLMGYNLNPVKAIANSSSTLLGGNSSKATDSNIKKAVIKDGIQTITMTANNNGYTPNAFYVQKGIPVKWIINGEQLNSCNDGLIVPSLNIDMKLKKGENVVKEFTPGDKDINFSCWMGMISGIIKVTDNLNSVDTSKADPSIPAPSTGPSCCAAPINDDGSSTNSGSTAQNSQSIYGSDITKVPTSTLVNKAAVSGNTQTSNFKGIGYELKPLIVVGQININTKVILDLTQFNNPEGQYSIIDTETRKEVASFTGKKGINEVDFIPQKSIPFAIVKNNSVMGVLEVVDDLNKADLEAIRSKYIN